MTQFYQLARYDLAITYKKGEEMYLADTLFRAFLPEAAKTENDPCLQILQIDLEADYSSDLLKSIRDASRIDPEMQSLIAILQTGWPRT